MTKYLTIDELMQRKGIADSEAFLDRVTDTIPLERASSPLVELRGSVHLMLGRTINRNEIDRRLAALRCL